MVIIKLHCQVFIHLASAARERFTTYALNDINRRDDNSLLSQHLDQVLGQDDASVSLLGQIGKSMNKTSVVGNGERG